MRVVLLHAYSRNNLGDGLLVDEALETLREAYGAADVTVVAIDRDSFRDVPSVMEWPTSKGNRVSAVLHGVRALAGASPSAEAAALASLVREVDLVVGVGGGYLRAPRGLAAVRTVGAHLPQLAAAARGETPSVYLPQSIGPLTRPIASRIRLLLNELSHVFVRDAVSAGELRHLHNVQRLPDLAVLSLARARPRPAVSGGSPPILVVRALQGDRTYIGRLRHLVTELGDPVFAIQSRGRGNDDTAFVARLIGRRSITTKPLPDLLAEFPGAPVVSVRLHGALMAIRCGSPAVHLSYERKGWGAYEDMNLVPYVHPARTFDPLHVSRQVSALSADATEFWLRLENRAGHIEAQREILLGTLRSVV